MRNYLIIVFIFFGFVSKAQDLVKVNSVQIIHNIHNYNLECFRVQFVMDSTFQKYLKSYADNATIMVKAYPKYNKKKRKYANFVKDVYSKYYNEITNGEYISNKNSDTINIDIPYCYFYLYSNNIYKVKFDLKIEVTEYKYENNSATNNNPISIISILEVDNLNSPTVMLQVPQLYEVSIKINEYNVANGKWDVKIMGNGGYDPDPFFKIIHGDNEIYESISHNDTYDVISNETSYFFSHLNDKVSIIFLDYDKASSNDHIATLNLDLYELLMGNQNEHRVIKTQSLDKLDYNLKIEACKLKY